MDNKVKISLGEIELRHPTAYQRNEAMFKSVQMLDGQQIVNMFKFLTELLPSCIKSHPFGTASIKNSLERLDFNEYDVILSKLKDMIKPKEEITKNSEEQLKDN